jgi:hypothetical protein
VAARAAAAAGAAAGDDENGTDDGPPARHPRPRSQAPTAPPSPPLTRADLLGRVRFNLQVARVNETGLDIDRMSDGGLRALLGDIQAALSLRRPQA